MPVHALAPLLAAAVLISPSADPDVHPHPGVLRSAPVFIHPDLFTAREGDTLSLPLFSDRTLTLSVVQVTRRPSGAAIQGRLTGGAEGTCTLTLDHGLVAGGFWTSAGSFGLTPSPADGPGACRAEQLDPAAVVQCLSMQDPTVPASAPGLPAGPLAARPISGLPGSSPARGAEPCGCPDDQSIIDVLCVYTTLAKNAAGGAAALQARFQNALDAANGALLNSGFSAGGVNRLQFRSAGAAEVAYDEAAPEWLDHLERITDPADGFMDQAHALRDAFHADTVMLIVDDPRFTGGSGWWAVWDPGQAFTCCNWRGLGGGSLLAAHELGHNLGCAHDREHDVSAPFSYAWGHYFSHAGQTYGTIMSYVGDVALQAYSNPHLTHAPSGQPMGVAPGQPRAAFNAWVINQTRWTLANYRDAARITDCNGNGVDDSTDIATGASLDLNADCRPDECESRRYIDADVPGFGEGASWATSAGDLGEIMEFAHLGCSAISQVWAADGVYTPDSGTGDRFRAVSLRDGLALYGGFQGRSRPGGGETSLAQRDSSAFESVLSGAIGSPAAADNSASVVYALGAGPSAILDGFTVRDGYADFSGAGLFLDASAPTIANCRITANTAGYGAGLVAWNPGPGVATLSGCSFENNTSLTGGGGAMSIYLGAAVSASRCAFTGNAALWGGAVSADDSSLTIASSIIAGNHATQYNGGGFDLNNDQFTLRNSIVAGNTAVQDGGGLWIANSTGASISNSTISANSSGPYTGGAVSYFATSTFTNTILWGNTGGLSGQDRQIAWYGEPLTVRYSRVQNWAGTLPGAGSSGADPLLADPAALDFTLLPGSSAIDAGDGAALPGTITEDVYGLPRRLDDPATSDTGPGPAPVIDIGAAEFQPAPSCPADLNGDGLVDFADYLEFLNYYDAGDLTVDFNQDGLVDFGDYLEFLNYYDAGC